MQKIHILIIGYLFLNAFSIEAQPYASLTMSFRRICLALANQWKACGMDFGGIKNALLSFMILILKKNTFKDMDAKIITALTGRQIATVGFKVIFYKLFDGKLFKVSV